MLRRCLSGVLLATVAACPSAPAVVDGRVVDGRVVDERVVQTGAVDAGAFVVDAGAQALVDAGSVPTVETIVDAGTMADVPTSTIPTTPTTPTTPMTPTTAKPDMTHPVTGFIHDRLLVKPKDASLSAANLERMVEKQLSAKVQMVRRTAGSFWLVQLSPTSPPRTKQDQERAVARLEKSGTFAHVEGDQLMTIKAGFGPTPGPMVNR
jgi:hypothetical protein